MLPNKIVLQSTGGAEIEITAGSERMKLKGHYGSGDKITIEWLDDEVVIKHNNNLALSNLLHLSVPEEFYVKTVIPSKQQTLLLKALNGGMNNYDLSFDRDEKLIKIIRKNACKSVIQNRRLQILIMYLTY